MNDTEVTVVGNVVDSPRRVSLQNGAVTNFRMASTARRYDSAHAGVRRRAARSGSTSSAGTSWAATCPRSVSKGDPVIVRGRADARDEWESRERHAAARRRSGRSPSGPTWPGAAPIFTRGPAARPPSRPTESGARPIAEPTAEDEQLARDLAEDCRPARTTTAGRRDVVRAGLRRPPPGTGARLVAPGWEDRR